MFKDLKTNKNIFILFIFLLGIFLGMHTTFILMDFPNSNNNNAIAEVNSIYIAETEQENAVITAVQKSIPSVVSIIVEKTSGVIYDERLEKDPFERFFRDLIPEDRNALERVGAGTGFIVSEDGLIMTNKHVVSDEKAVYSILTNEGETFKVEVLAKNPVQDIAILRIQDVQDRRFKPLKLGDSSVLNLGQSVIAIGNALGEFQNTVSVGVVSGLQRNIVAQGNNTIETLEDIIQTDAAINRGNSGGPLLNLRGEVIGINTAVSMDGENISFAVPINKAKRDVEQVLIQGKIAYPFLGIKYLVLNDEYAKELNLNVNYGALIADEPLSITPNSPAEKAELKEGDIILEFDHQKISTKNTLAKIIQDYFPGQEIEIKVLRNEKEFLINVVLGDWNDF